MIFNVLELLLCLSLQSRPPQELWLFRDGNCSTSHDPKSNPNLLYHIPQCSIPMALGHLQAQ